jgi:hypothetical protein
MGNRNRNRNRNGKYEWGIGIGIGTCLETPTHAKKSRASRSMSSQVYLQAFGLGETHIFMKNERGASVICTSGSQAPLHAHAYYLGAVHFGPPKSTKIDEIRIFLGDLVLDTHFSSFWTIFDDFWEPPGSQMCILPRRHALSTFQENLVF